MDKAQILCRRSEDGLEMTIEIENEGGARATITMNAAELEQFIQGVGQARASMAEQVPTELDPGMRLPTLTNPVWVTHVEDGANAAALVLRHPCLGWHGYMLPAAEARNMGASLMGIADHLDAAAA